MITARAIWTAAIEVHKRPPLEASLTVAYGPFPSWLWHPASLIGDGLAGRRALNPRSLGCAHRLQSVAHLATSIGWVSRTMGPRCPKIAVATSRGTHRTNVDSPPAWPSKTTAPAPSTTTSAAAAAPTTSAAAASIPPAPATAATAITADYGTRGPREERSSAPGKRQAITGNLADKEHCSAALPKRQPASRRKLDFRPPEGSIPRDLTQPSGRK